MGLPQQSTHITAKTWRGWWIGRLHPRCFPDVPEVIALGMLVLMTLRMMLMMVMKPLVLNCAVSAPAVAVRAAADGCLDNAVMG
eukprot:615173-Pyramimonas_sp.AAC.1